MDSEELQMHFVNNLRDFDFLSNRNAEMWFDLQGGYSYDDNALPDEEELEETLYNPLQRQG
jgi:hypothetical protein